MFAAPTPLCPFQKEGGKVLDSAFMAHCFTRFYLCGLWRGELPQPLPTTDGSVCRTKQRLQGRPVTLEILPERHGGLEVKRSLGV